MRIASLAAAVLAAAALTGCGEPPRGRVHGTVKYQGKPLTNATVIFLAKDNRTHPVELKPDGSFEATGVAYGPVKVSVQQGFVRVPAKAEPGKGGKAGVDDEKAGKEVVPPPEVVRTGPTLPAHYADPAQSGLTFELNAPDLEWSVDLK